MTWVSGAAIVTFECSDADFFGRLTTKVALHIVLSDVILTIWTANLYGGVRTNVSTDKAIKWYIANGASAGKINMGIPLYGRAFEETTGIGAPYNGVGSSLQTCWSVS